MATTKIIHQLKNFHWRDSVAIVAEGVMSMLLVCMLSRYPLKNLIVVGHHDWRLDLIKSSWSISYNKLIKGKCEGDNGSDRWKRC